MISTMSLYVLQKGDRSDPPVICLHGVLGAARNLYRLIETIAADGFLAVAYDQRGHGHSPHLPPYSIDSLASDVFAVMDSLHLDAAHLVGHSLGGRVVLMAATLNPSRVKTVSILDAGITVNRRSIADLHDMVDLLPRKFHDKTDAQEFVARYPKALAQFLLMNLRTAPDGSRHWVFDLAGLRASIWDALSCDLTEHWVKMSCPTLVLRGERSENLVEGDFQKMLRLNPQAEGRVICGAGHWLHVDNFPDTVGAVLHFLGNNRSI